MGKSWQSLVIELRHFYTVQKSIQGWHVPNRLKVVLEAERGEVSGTPHPPRCKGLLYAGLELHLYLLNFVALHPTPSSRQLLQFPTICGLLLFNYYC